MLGDFVTSVQKLLKKVRDIPRAIVRIKKCSATANDWWALFVTIEASLPILELTATLIRHLQSNQQRDDDEQTNADVNYLLKLKSKCRLDNKIK